MLSFLFLGTSIIAFLILASGCEVYSSMFESCCCLSRSGNKFSIKFAVKMFKPTRSFISASVGTYGLYIFCIFFVLT